MNLIFKEIQQERSRQDAKFGPQRNHTPAEWLMILGEEVGEVNQAALQAHFNYPLPGEGLDLDDPVSSTERRQARWISEYRKELVQVAAVTVAMLESLDRQKKQL